MTELTEELRSLKDELKALRESLDDFKEQSKNTIHLKALTMMFVLLFALVTSINVAKVAVERLPEILDAAK